MTLDEVAAINTKVNKLPYMKELFEDWRPADDLWGGDCDSYATRKMQELVNAGMDVAFLRLATCLTEHGGAHCVLLVDVNLETYVLDNRTPHPTHWQLLPYTWKKIQIAGTPNWEEA